MKNKKVLLINPPTPDFVRSIDKHIPNSLLYLGSSLQQDNHNVKLIDINNKSVDIENEINYFKPDLIGITCLFSGRFKNTMSLSRKIKGYSPELPIIIGGIHPTIFAKEILEDYSCVDYICLGEGEKTLRNFVNEKKLEGIDGLAYRESNKIKINPKTSFIKNLDELPFPAYNLINLKDYHFNTSHWNNPKGLPISIPVPIISSRSCPNRCTFCSMFLVHGEKWRPRSANNVVDEIEHLYNKYNQRYFSFMDDNMTLSKKRTLKITREIINRGLDIQFDTPNGVAIKSLDKEVMDSLVEAGLVRICVAPESGSEFIRNKMMKKKLPTKDIYNFFEMVKDYKNLNVKAFFIMGYPQETKETLKETYDMIKKISPSLDQITIFDFIPYPGTEIFEYCKNKGLIDIPLNNLYNIETFSSYNGRDKFSNYDGCDDSLIKPYKLEMDELKKFRKEAYKLVVNRKKGVSENE